jgi:hypothetical protein
MTGLTNRFKWSSLLRTVLSIAVAIFALGLFSVLSYVGWVTLKQSDDFCLNFLCIQTGLYLLLFYPGIVCLLVMAYFFLYLRGWIYFFIGIFACFLSVSLHFFISIPTVHMPGWGAFLSGLIELGATLLLLYLFHKYIFGSKSKS